MWRVTEKENDPFFPIFYYRCPSCLSFSAPQIYFPADKYETLPIEFYAKGAASDTLSKLRVESLLRHLNGDTSRSVLLDLGSGGGWASKEFTAQVPEGHALAIEIDTRLREPYYDEFTHVQFVPMLIDDFLAQYISAVERGERGGADTAIMTDVLEHVLWPERTVELVLRAMRPGGIGYFVVPNSLTFQAPAPAPVAPSEVDWAHAKHTCQHIWTMTPGAFEAMFERAGWTVLAHDLQSESDIRQDGVYSAVIVRR
jgi:SAM-dependent methyltransferase